MRTVISNCVPSKLPQDPSVYHIAICHLSLCYKKNTTKIVHQYTIQNKISNFDSWLDFDLLKKNEPNVSI